jgi:hypothetical protein
LYSLLISTMQATWPPHLILVILWH